MSSLMCRRRGEESSEEEKGCMEDERKYRKESIWRVITKKTDGQRKVKEEEIEDNE